MVEIISSLISQLSALVFYKTEIAGIEIELIVIWLALPMVIFTVYLGFINLRGMRAGVQALKGKFLGGEPPGNMSPFAALSTALSGTVGLGNIAGVAIALSMGGPGAAFWMFIIGWFAMTLKCAEVTLGVKYRTILANGDIRGGPMYSFKNGLTSKGWPKLGLILGGVYALFALIGAIPLIQVNQSYAQVANVTGFDNPWAYGFILAAMVGLVIISGVRWLARVTSTIVPAMGLVYLGGVFAILIGNYDQVPAAIALIVSDAFSGEAAAGGSIGAFVVGMRRAVYSSEAGIGSAVIAHTQAKTSEPASEGLVALLEPFIDTVIICSLGAIAMVVAGTYAGDAEGIKIASDAFATVADWFPYLLSLAVFLFGFSTLCAWGFYGQQAWGYLFGHGTVSIWIFKFTYVLCLPVGAVLELGQVVDLVDSAFFLMAVPNVIALYIFAPEIKREISEYLERRKEG